MTDRDKLLRALVKPLEWEQLGISAFVAECRLTGIWTAYSEAKSSRDKYDAERRARIAAALDLDKVVALVEAARLAEQQLIRLGYDGSSPGLTAALAALGITQGEG